MSDLPAPNAAWRTPRLEPLTDVEVSADVTAPIRNLIASAGT